MPTPREPTPTWLTHPTCTQAGLVGPGGKIAPGQTFDPDVLESYCDAEETTYQEQVQSAGGAAGLQDPALQSVCALVQLTPSGNPGDFSSTGTCSAAKDPGWCYVTGAAAGVCPQAILFTSGEPPDGATVSLQCQ